MLDHEEFVDRNLIKVRRASASDAVSISSLYRQLMSNPAVSISPDHLQTLAGSESHFVLVAEQDGVVKGTVLLSLCADVMFHKQPFAVVENIIVDQGARYYCKEIAFSAGSRETVGERIGARGERGSGGREE